MNRLIPNGQQAPGGARVLVVDDDPQVVQLFSDFLRDEGYRVLACSEGDEAIDTARRESVDLILLDVRMPGLDGYETTRRLKNDPATRNISIILVTALGDPENKIMGLEAGADEFLPKPVDRSELLVRIRSMLRLRNYREQLLHHALSGGAEDTGSEGEAAAAEPRRVLAALDDGSERDLVCSSLAEQGYMVAAAPGEPGEARALLQQGTDLVITDSSMSEGFFTELRQKWGDPPAVVLCPPTDPELRVRLLDRGVSELLVRPFDRREVALRVGRLLMQRARLSTLEQQYKKALSAATNDSMTKLSNNGYFRRFLDLEVKRSRRHNHPTSLIMLDIDDFKAKNDSFGHAVGDHILIETAALIRQSVREIDLAARYGGEEFAVVLPHTGRAGAAAVAERIRSAIAGAVFTNGGSVPRLTVTASFGVAVCPDDATSPDDLIRSADELLYRAKESGKNKVCIRR